MDVATSLFSLSLSQSPGHSSCLLSLHSLTLLSRPVTWRTDFLSLLPGVMAANVGHTTHKLDCCGVR